MDKQKPGAGQALRGGGCKVARFLGEVESSSHAHSPAPVTVLEVLGGGINAMQRPVVPAARQEKLYCLNFCLSHSHSRQKQGSQTGGMGPASPDLQW